MSSSRLHKLDQICLCSSNTSKLPCLLPFPHLSIVLPDVPKKHDHILQNSPKKCCSIFLLLSHMSPNSVAHLVVLGLAQRPRKSRLQVWGCSPGGRARLEFLGARIAVQGRPRNAAGAGVGARGRASRRGLPLIPGIQLDPIYTIFIV